jgi:hypothetical protein
MDHEPPLVQPQLNFLSIEDQDQNFEGEPKP